MRNPFPNCHPVTTPDHPGRTEQQESTMSHPRVNPRIDAITIAISIGIGIAIGIAVFDNVGIGVLIGVLAGVGITMINQRIRS